MKQTLSALAFAVTISTAIAQPVPKLTRISQEYFQRGSSVQITLNGENISPSANFLIAGEPGLKLIIPPPAASNVGIEATTPGISAVPPSDTGKLIATLEIAADAALGLREIRVASPSGVSNPLNVNISHLPEISSDSGATSFEKAQPVSLPFAITGAIQGAAESDFYRFAAKKGQRVVIEAVAQRIGSQIDSSLAILDKNGREVARNEDAVGNDSVLEFVPAEDGDYIIQIRDYRLQGGDNFKYRLLAGVLPYVKIAFPFGGRRGETTEIQLSGHNLSEAEKMILRLDPSAKGGRQELRAANGLGLSNPFPFVISDLPQVMEAEPNTSLTHANDVTLPAAINGRIQAAKDYDAFKFHAEKDQRFVFEIAATRFGSQLDALLTLADINGNVLQRNDDSNSADARIDHTFGAAGEYFIFVEDLLERGGPEFIYRLNCTQPAPDFEVRFVNDAIRVPRGGRVPVRCEVTRLNNFGEPIRVYANSLPTGLHAEPLVLTGNDPSAGFIFISAAPDAPQATGLIQLDAAAVINGRNVTHAAKPFAMDRPVLQAYVTVIDAAPFLIHPGQLFASIEQDQTVNIDALIERRDGFNGEVKVSLEGFSAGREPVTKSFDYQPITIKGAESRGSIPIKAKLDSEIGARMMVLKAESTHNGQPVSQFSVPFPVATSQIPFLLSTTLKRLTLTALPPGTESSAGESIFIVRAERRAGFGGDISLSLEGVPEGITATVDKIPANAGEVNVKLIASEKAVAGVTNLTLTGTGVFKDKSYRFKPQAIGLQVNAPEPSETKTVATNTPAVK